MHLFKICSTKFCFFAQILNSFIISHLLELSKGRQLFTGIKVAFDQCDYRRTFFHIYIAHGQNSCLFVFKGPAFLFSAPLKMKQFFLQCVSFFLSKPVSSLFLQFYQIAQPCCFMTVSIKTILIMYQFHSDNIVQEPLLGPCIVISKKCTIVIL